MSHQMAMDRVKKLDIGIEPDAAVSGAVVIESEYSTFLTFNAMRTHEDGQFEDVGTAVIEFVGAMKSQFGHPNDEALEGHPLSARGLDYNDAFEVEDSTWLKTIREQNRMCFPDATWFGESLRHFVVTFHDSTFECLAEDLKVTIRTEPYRTIIGEIAERILVEVR